MFIKGCISIYIWNKHNIKKLFTEKILIHSLIFQTTTLKDDRPKEISKII